LPFFAFYPLFIVLFGLGRGAIVAIGFLFGVVAMIIATLNGFDRIPRVLLRTAAVHHMSPTATALRIKPTRLMTASPAASSSAIPRAAPTTAVR
jgi:NitT/TauT family transport system permease protein